MAFNPFHSFRKHRKVYFAILTIVCMFVFVLSSGIGGGADALDSIASWFGGGRSRGKDVTTLYGDTVTERQIGEATEHRQLVSDFMLASIAEAQTQTTKDLAAELEKLGKQQPGQDFKIADAELESELRYAATLRSGIARFGQNFLGTIRLNRLQEAVGHYAAADALRNSFLNERLDEQIQARLGQNFEAMLTIARYSRERSPEDVYQDVLRSVARLENLRGKLIEQKRTREADLVEDMIAQLHLDAWLLNPERVPGEFVLGGSQRTDDMLDFMVWKHQADKLGITVTEQDARKEFNRLVGKEVLTGDSTHDREALNRVFKGRVRAVEPSELYKALVDEFRVAQAQAIMLGRAPGFKGYRDGDFNVATTAVTPGEFYDYFRQQRTDMDLMVLPVPVSSVLALAQADPGDEALKKAFGPTVAAALREFINRKPTDAKLNRLFEANKNREPEPWSDRPGFKQPRKVSVEWVKVPEEPDAQRLAQARTQLAGVWVGTDPWHALNRMVLLHREVRPAVETIRGLYPTPGLFEADPALAFVNAGGDRHLDVATFVLQAAIPAGSIDHMASLGALVKNQATLVSRHGKTQSKTIEAERQERSVAAAQYVVDALAKLATGVPVYFANTSRKESGEPVLVDPLSEGSVVSAEAVADKSLAWAIYRLARRGMMTDVEGFQEAIAKANEDPGNGDKLIQEALAKYHFKPYYGGPTRLLDQYAVKKEPALKGMLEEHQKSLKGMEALGGSSEARFASRFFAAPAKYQPDQMGPYTFWKKEDMPAQEPKTMDEQTRKQVVEAWRLQEARPIAQMIARSLQDKLAKRAQEAKLQQNVEEARKKAADETRQAQEKAGVAQPEVIAAMVREAADAAERKVVREFYDKEFAELAKLFEPIKFTLGTPFTLDRVAHLRKSTRLDVNNYDAWKAPEETMPYPVAYFIDSALALSPGEATVLPDRPQENFYLVAQLVERTPTVQQAFDEHETAARLKTADPLWESLVQTMRLLLLDGGNSPSGDPIWKSYVQEQSKKTRKEVLNRLRREAGAVNARGQFEVAEGIRRDESPDGER